MKSEDLPHTVHDALRAGNKIEAIKRLRSLTGLGLKEAKERIDAYAGGGDSALRDVRIAANAGPDTAALEFQKAINALTSGNRDDAIRSLRALKDVGLAEAKAMVARLEKEMPAHVARASSESPRVPGLAPGEVPRASGPDRWFVLAVVVAIGLVAAYFYR